MRTSAAGSAADCARADAGCHVASGRQWMMLLASVGFLAAVFLAPDRYLPAGREHCCRSAAEMQKLTEKVQVLKQEQIVPPEKAQVLEKDLERIRQEAVGKDPAKTMEAIDHLEQSFNKAAAEAAESAIKQTEAASRAQELAQALAESPRARWTPSSSATR